MIKTRKTGYYKALLIAQINLVFVNLLDETSLQYGDSLQPSFEMYHIVM